MNFVYAFDRESKKTLPKWQGLFGAGDVTRTRDLLITNQLHYRLCYTSETIIQNRLMIAQTVRSVNTFFLIQAVFCIYGETEYYL